MKILRMLLRSEFANPMGELIVIEQSINPEAMEKANDATIAATFREMLRVQKLRYKDKYEQQIPSRS